MMTVVGSFYWRIAISFLVFVVAMLVAQSAMFSVIMSRSSGPVPPLYVVMKDGSVTSNTRQPLDPDIRRFAIDTLQAPNRGDVTRMPGGSPLATAPIYLAGERLGMVVLARPPRGALGRDLPRLAVPGTIVLIVVTLIAAVVIFGPARRRLRALEDAAERLGAGDLTARAPERGADEIAHVAAAFNRMAAELAAREQSLRAADRVRRQMLADVSHELKTPLTAMRGYVESLRMAGDMFAPEQRERYLSTLERETLRLDRIVKDLLDLGRLEDDAMRIEKQIFAVGRVFERVIARHEVEASTRHVTFRATVDEDADQMTGDPHRIEQVVENLVANALRYTAAGGRVDLSAAAESDSIRIAVIDSGEGIPAEHLPHVFDRFYKADSARTDPTGSGLGLSIVKAIVERHGGHVSVNSCPGRTAFTLTFPQDAPSTAARPR